MQYAKRQQKSYESFEDYSNELKRLYDKAYPSRPASIRREDLLQKFLSGLSSRKVRKAVEFVKQPNSVEEAVVEAVNYVESSKKHVAFKDNATVHAVYEEEESETDEDSTGYDRVARLPDKKKNSQSNSKSQSAPESETVAAPANSTHVMQYTGAPTTQLGVNAGAPSYSVPAVMTNTVNGSYPHHGNGGWCQNYNGSGSWQNGYQGGNNNNNRMRQTPAAGYQHDNSQQMRPRGACFLCGSVQHFKRDCPNRRQSQYQQGATGWQNRNQGPQGFPQNHISNNMATQYQQGAAGWQNGSQGSQALPQNHSISQDARQAIPPVASSAQVSVSQPSSSVQSN